MTLRRALLLGLNGLSGLWLVLWLSVALDAGPPQRLCVDVHGVVRGAVHVHPVDHSDSDRSWSVVSAARELCLDFVVVTNHNALPCDLLHSPPASPTFLDGAEWTVGAHHHGQLTGQLGLAENTSESVRFRVLNHPSSSKIHSLDDLTQDEVEALKRGDMGIEVLNASRLLRSPQEGLPLALAAGLVRFDLLTSAVSLPGRDVRLWAELQIALERRIPMVCGSDAHGGLVDYVDAFPTMLMYLQGVHAPVTGDEVVRALKEGRAACVNENLGSPGPFSLQLHGSCRARVSVEGLDGGLWKLVRNGTEVVEHGENTQELTIEQAGYYHLEIWRDVSFGIFGEYERLWGLTSGFLIRERCRKQ